MLGSLKEKKVKYYLNTEGEFVIENYNFSKPFANFFPGIAGKYGIPMWVFYVNRGQAIASFGTKDKDHAILEFFPANKAWQLTASYGFRTFIKINSGKKTIVYEPFHNGFSNLEFNLKNKMLISPWGLKIEEENSTLGLKVSVEYFNIPNDHYAGLSRVVTIHNTGRLAKDIQLLDGLPQVVPFGTSNMFLKKLGRTIEAWMEAENLQNNAPFFKLSVDPADRPEVIHIKEGNFYLSFEEGKKPCRPIVNPEYIFGPNTDFAFPWKFLAGKSFGVPKEQIMKSRMPCAFSFFKLGLPGKSAKAFYSLIGQMQNLETLNSSLSRISSAGYLRRKAEENKQTINGLQNDINTSSSSQKFDLYCRQTYLDNILRGGYPVVFKTESSNSLFYLYSRKHGDMERDYNKFQMQPSYFSQGNGNYRDVNQNRRSDIWFNPLVMEETLVNLTSLIQSDGFNPLVVKGMCFSLKNREPLKEELKKLTEEKNIEKILSFLTKHFTPGEAILFLEENKIKLNGSYDEFLSKVISFSEKIQEAEHGEGFWTDHWAYNLDLLESYLGVYPEKLKDIFFRNRNFTFFDNSETVKPRDEKYILKDGAVRQFHAVAPDAAKKELIKKRDSQPHLVRQDYGAGKIYRTTLTNKLLCLLANKLASLDPFGIGIEMEAGKPNWFDALNGLPGLLGSSLCETLELKRLINTLKAALDKNDSKKITVTEEVLDLLKGLEGLINGYFSSASANRDFLFWDKSHLLKEEYRDKVNLGFSGRETEINTDDLKTLLNRALEKTDTGIKKAEESNLYYSYFINEATEHEVIKEHFVRPRKFIQKRIPLFLEGQMHALRTAENTESARKIYQATKKSALYDNTLKMYKVTAPLKDMPEEIGRCRVFTPGWLENESIWLHMEYKYLLEILKTGLYEEFYAEFKNLLIPFQDPRSYGRSILENCSFLVSSAFPDKNLHGNGFVARLSGSTAEFLQIWLGMNAGLTPFLLNDNGKLILRFQPKLASWLFKKDKTYSFNFLSKTKITYHNPQLKNTFGKNNAVIKRITFRGKEGKPIEILSDTIPSPYAESIRNQEISSIDIYLE
jgi:hypothetical protein